MPGRVILIFALITTAAFGQPAAQSYRDAAFRQGPEPGIRFSSGLTVCDEALHNGHWVSRYWLSTGMIKPEFHLENERRQWEGLPLDAFELSMEGQDLAGSWEWVSAKQTEVHGPDGLLVSLDLSSKARPIKVRVKTLLHGGPVVIRWLEITNTGQKPTAITRVSPWSGLLWDTPGYKERIGKDSEAAFEVAYTEYQDWGHEGAWRFEPVVNTTKTISGTRGKSGWGHPTFFARNDATGEWFVGSLGWSGNWTIQLTGRQDPSKQQARLFFSMGPSTADPALRVLEPGETVKTPEAHLLPMRADLDHVIQALHEHVRRNVLPPPVPGREYQVEVNHRGYIVDHEDEPGLNREIDLAADIGGELFMVDAGWYGPEPNRWWQNAGDWYAGAWLPNDLNPVREYARKKGLLFGLWVEIESVGAAAKLREQHPDWILTRNGRPVAEGRQLDVSKPEVAAWMESEIARLIKKYDLDMLRLDYNTTVNEGGNRVKDGFVENTEWRHVEALYAMFDRLRKQFPRVIFQNCAGGGGRLDLGILRRFHNTELSDWMRAPRGLKILNGMTWILPPEILLRTFGTEVGDHATDGDLDLQLRTVMMSRPIFRGISPSPEEFNPILRQKIRDAVELFKRTVRPILVNSRVYHHTPLTPMLEPSPWVVLEYAAPESDRAVAALFRTSQEGDPTFRFRPRGLDVARTYRVTFGNGDKAVEMPGLRLIEEGIPVRLEAALTSQMLIFEAVPAPATR
ncbi:MAG: alpha-galactosidase [Acidobacteria bacterium]|nr:alpha-galactosidase [Acidobacteriota bacterium]